MVKDAVSRKITDVINQNGMKQLVKKPTRTTETSKSLIDYVISNNYMLKYKFLVNEKISDHETISFSLNTSLQPKNKSKAITKLVNYSDEKFKNNLLNVNWNDCINMDVNQKANFVINNIKNSLDEFVKTVEIKNKNGEDWYSEQLYAERVISRG